MRRVFWMGVGAGAGVSGTVWAERKVRGQLDALAARRTGRRPRAIKAKAVGRSVVDAVADGRGAMREREPSCATTTAAATPPTGDTAPAGRPVR